jgi:hypothetical protein
MKYRFAISVIVGCVLSFFSVGVFTMWQNITELHNIFKASFLRGVAMMLGSNFNYDVISLLRGNEFDIFKFLAPPLLAWLFVGYISGSIAKGVRNAFTAGILVMVITLLIWILLAVIAGEDLMALFQGNQLFLTLGGILGSLIGVSVGSLLGGYISGPEELI